MFHCLYDFTFFFWASMALRFSSSFILSWIISEAMIWEGSLREGVTGLGDVIGKGGVESCKKVQSSLTSIEGQGTPMQIMYNVKEWMTQNSSQTWEEMFFVGCVYGILRSELSGVVPPLLLPSNFLNFCSAKLVIRTMPAPEPPEDDMGLTVWDLVNVAAELGQGLLLSTPSPLWTSGLVSVTPLLPPSLFLCFSGGSGRGHDLVMVSQSGSISE